jgi:hypothetical protein
MGGARDVEGGDSSTADGTDHKARIFFKTSVDM